MRRVGDKGRSRCPLEGQAAGRPTQHTHAEKEGSSPPPSSFPFLARSPKESRVTKLRYPALHGAFVLPPMRAWQPSHPRLQPPRKGGGSSSPFPSSTPSSPVCPPNTVSLPSTQPTHSTHRDAPTTPLPQTRPPWGEEEEGEATSSQWPTVRIAGRRGLVRQPAATAQGSKNDSSLFRPIHTCP